jgi:hypothetical protein
VTGPGFRERRNPSFSAGAPLASNERRESVGSISAGVKRANAAAATRASGGFDRGGDIDLVVTSRGASAIFFV